MSTKECPECEGWGELNGEDDDGHSYDGICPKCDGRGVIPLPPPTPTPTTGQAPGHSPFAKQRT